MVDNMSSHLVKEAKKYQEQLNSASLTEKAEALNQFEKIGLPGKKDETWKYTHASSFLTENLKLGTPQGTLGERKLKEISLGKTLSNKTFS